MTRHSAALNGASAAASDEAGLDPIAAAGLMLVLGGYVGAPAAERDARNRQRFQI